VIFAASDKCSLWPEVYAYQEQIYATISKIFEKMAMGIFAGRRWRRCLLL